MAPPLCILLCALLLAHPAHAALAQLLGGDCSQYSVLKVKIDSEYTKDIPPLYLTVSQPVVGHEPRGVLHVRCVGDSIVFSDGYGESTFDSDGTLYIDSTNFRGTVTIVDVYTSGATSAAATCPALMLRHAAHVVYYAAFIVACSLVRAWQSFSL